VVFKERLRDAYREDLENAKDWRSGAERAVMDLEDSIGNEADLAEKALTSLFDNATDAIVNFAKTGKFNFKQFASSVAQDILRITTRMLMLKALKTALGVPSAPGLADGGMPEMADGGRVRGPGGPRSDIIPTWLSSGEFVVNARSAADNLPLLEAINDGKDIMSRMASGGLVNEKSTMPAMPTKQERDEEAPEAAGNGPSSNVQVAVVLSDSDVANAFAGEAGTRVLVDAIEKNRNEVRAVLNG